MLDEAVEEVVAVGEEVALDRVDVALVGVDEVDVVVLLDDPTTTTTVVVPELPSAPKA